MRQSQMSFLAPSVLAKAYRKVGQVEEGLTVLAKALAFVDKTGMRVSEAEMYRIKGELTLQQFKVQGSKFPAPSTQYLAPKRRRKPKRVF